MQIKIYYLHVLFQICITVHSGADDLLSRQTKFTLYFKIFALQLNNFKKLSYGVGTERISQRFVITHLQFVFAVQRQKNERPTQHALPQSLKRRGCDRGRRGIVPEGENE